MDPEIAVNKAVQTMIMKGIVSEEDRGDAREIAMQIWTAGFDYHRINGVINSKKRKINYYSKDGVLLQTFNSIAETGRKLKIGRGTVDDILYGKSKGRRNTGNYFRYADDENNG